MLNRNLGKVWRVFNLIPSAWPAWTFIIVLILFYFLVHQLNLEQDVLTLKKIEFSQERPSNTEEKQLLSGEQLPLPDHWRKRGYTENEAWYRANLHLNVPLNRLWGLYIPAIGTNADVYLNGMFLGNGGTMGATPAKNDFRPLYFAIPNGMLKPEANLIELKVVSDTSCGGFLGPLVLGPDEILRPAYKRAYFIRVTLVQFIFVSMLVSMFYVGMLALNTREPIYFYFTGMLAASSLFHLSVIVVESPFPGWFWDWVRMLGTGWLVVFVILFVHRLMSLSRPWLEYAMLIWAVIGSITILVAPLKWQYPLGSYYWDVLTIVWGIYAFIAAFMVCLKTRSQEHVGISLSILVLLGAGVRDWLVYTDNPGGFHGTLLIYSVLYPLVVFAWILLQRFTFALNEAKTLNQEQETKVCEREAELAYNYEKIHQVQKHQALVEERERIMRDMHDGIGGQLISATAAAKNCARGEIVDSLEVALADLRLMIDSFEPVYDDLTTVLGLIRMRLEKRLGNHGLRFDWQVGDIAEVPDLAPHKVLQVMRIIEEAVTNIVRHANANRITVIARDSFNFGDMGVFVEIQDDGIGIGDYIQKGRGLDNMSHRAESIGGILSIEAIQPGTSVRLWLPVSIRKD